MAAQLSTKLTLDGSQHNDALRNAAKEVSKYKREVDNANKELNNLQKGVSSTTSSISGMINSLKSGDIMGFANGAKNAGSAIKSLIPVLTGATGAATGLGTAITFALGPIGLIAAGVAAVVAVSAKAVSSIENFNTALLDLSALTGVTGKELESVGDIARDMSVKFGTSSSDIIASMKNIGSQAPQLLSDMGALSSVTESAMVLSKAAGMSVEDTAKAITTIMNQMNVDASQTSEIINSMAAGSKYGAADVQYLTTAFEKCGTQAKGAGMSFQQVIAAVETIAPKFSSADGAGQALNGVLRNLQTQANSQFNPAIVGLSKALENLGNANLSLVEKQKLVGAEGLTVLNTMLENRQAFEDMTTQVSGTNVAYEQMTTKEQTLSEMSKKLSSNVEDLFIEIGKSAPIKALIKLIGIAIGSINSFISFIKDCIKIINKLWEKFTETAGVQNFLNMFNKLKKGILDVLSVIVKQWNRFLEWLGVSTKKPITIKTEIKEDKITTQTTNSSTNNNSTSTNKKGVNVKVTPIVVDDDIDKVNKKVQDKFNELEERRVKIKIKPELSSYEKAIGKTTKFDSIEQEMNYNDRIISQLQDLQLEYFKLGNIGSEAAYKLNDDLNELYKTQAKLADAAKQHQQEAEMAKRKASMNLNGNPNENENYKNSPVKPKENKFDKFSNDAFDITGAFNGIDGVVGSIESLTNAIDEGANAWEVFMGIVQMVNSVISAVGDTIQAVTTIQKIFGVATQETSAIQTAATEQDTANTSQHIANAMSETVANEGKAISGATASGAKMPFPYNLVAIAAGIAAVIGAFAMIGSFADGGIIQGRSTIGDYNLARVNGGEMILNTRQQNNLFRAINENRLGSNGGVVGGTVKIKGSDLYVALKNYGNTKSKVGKNIGIR